MKELKLTKYVQTNATVLDNEFIDQYMVRANGEYVKVYLLLLRHMNQSSGCLSVSELADLLECTEKDVLRALRYWKSEGLLDYLDDTPDDPTPQSTVRSSVPTSELHDVQSGYMTASVPSMTNQMDYPVDSVEAPVSAVPASTTNIQQYRSRKERAEFKELLFVAEQYLGKTLSATDIDQITYFYDTLHMSADLIEYLIESCVENGHKSIHYIKKVAFSWVEEGIETVSQAKEQSMLYSRSCYTVLNAFGIKGRGPAASELEFIKKWSEQYAFSSDIIAEACRRTITSTHQPSFEYADSILTKWHEHNIRHLKEISALDEAHQKQNSAVRTAARQKPVTKNLNNFERRSYDMESLEEQLLKSN